MLGRLSPFILGFGNLLGSFLVKLQEGISRVVL